MAERDIRKALKARVEAYGGEVRAVSWLGRRHAPDVLCLFPPSTARDCNDPGYHIFVETKDTGRIVSGGQLREHDRMRQAGCEVLIIRTLGQLDDWLPPL